MQINFFLFRRIKPAVAPLSLRERRAYNRFEYTSVPRAFIMDRLSGPFLSSEGSTRSGLSLIARRSRGFARSLFCERGKKSIKELRRRERERERASSLISLVVPLDLPISVSPVAHFCNLFFFSRREQEGGEEAHVRVRARGSYFSFSLSRGEKGRCLARKLVC